MVLAQTVLHLCVNDAYEKYMKMIVGLITAMIVLLPIIAFIKEGGMEDFESYRTKYEAEMFGSAPDFEQIKEDAWESYWGNTEK